MIMHILLLRAELCASDGPAAFVTKIASYSIAFDSFSHRFEQLFGIVRLFI